MSWLLVDGLCRIYSTLLYAYPADFRREYGRPMRQLFRDGCRDAARRKGAGAVMRYALRAIGDWLGTVVEERIAFAKGGPAPGRRVSSVTEWAGTLLIYLFATTTLVQAYVVPTGSMESTVLIGDHMLVDRMAYADPGQLGRSVLPYREVERGDVIVFLYPEDIRQTYVKRVIGLPGDRIRLAGGQVIRNGKRLSEPYTQHIAGWPDRYRDDFPQAPAWSTTPRGRDMLAHHVENGEVVVPPGTIFALGDNRDNSSDSRYWGFVPREYVVGKPLFVYWSYDAPTEALQEWNLDHVVDVAEHFFTRTRWKRMFYVPRSEKAMEGGAQ